MASIKISELEEVTKLSTSDVLPIINENKTKKVSLEKLNEILGGNGGEVDFGIEILDIPGALKSDSSSGNPNSYHTDAATCELLSNYINSCKDKQLQSIIVKYGPELQFAGVFSPLFGASTVNTSVTLYKLNTSMKDARYPDIATQTGTVAYFCDEITLYIKGTWTNGVYSCTGYCVHNTIRNMITQSYVDEKTLLKTNTTAFTPTGDYNPATKKYVDDAVANIDIPEGDGGNSGLPQPMYFVVSNNITIGSDNTDSDICAKFGEILTNARAFWNANGMHQIVLIDNKDYTNVIFKSKPGSFGTYYGTCYYPKVFDTLEKTYELKLTYSSSNSIYTVTKFRINEITVKRTATDPTENNQVATKKYVDDSIASINIPETGGEGVVKESPIIDLKINASLLSGNLNITDEEILGKVSDAFTKYNKGEISLPIFNVMGSLTSIPQLIFIHESQPTTIPLNGNIRYTGSTIHSVVGNLRAYTTILSFTVSSDSDNNCTVNGMTFVNAANGKVLLTPENTSSYTPTSDYNPATKKYVDDAITTAITSVLEAGY